MRWSFNNAGDLSGMNASTKFARADVLSLFADDFGRTGETESAATIAEVPPAPAAPSLADVDAAYADGLRAGAAAAEAAALRQTEATLQCLMAELATLGAESQQAAEAAASGLAELLLGAFARFFPALSERFGPAEAMATTRLILAGLHNEPEVVIRASVPTISALERLFSQQSWDSATKITLVPTDMMPPGDVSMRWREGQATRDTNQLWTEINEVLGLHGLHVVAQPIIHQKELAHG